MNRKALAALLGEIGPRGTRRVTRAAPEETPRMRNRLGCFGRFVTRTGLSAGPVPPATRSCEIGRSDMLFLAAGRWHQVEACTVTIGTSFTHLAWPGALETSHTARDRFRTGRATGRHPVHPSRPGDRRGRAPNGGTSHTTLARRLPASAALAAPAAPASAVISVLALLGGRTGSWALPASAVPDSVFPGDGFTLPNVSGTVDGVTVTDRMAFHAAGCGGGACAGAFCGILSRGPQLFTGSGAAPAFTLGTFATTDLRGMPAATRTITFGGGVIPEPGTRAMTIAGFGLVGTGLCRRRAAVPA